MLHSTFSLFSESPGSWDTSCARKYLLIPEEQLNMIDNIPEWSRVDISRNSAANRETRFENTGNPSILPAVSLDKDSYLRHNRRPVDTDIIKEHCINSDSQLFKKVSASLLGKEEFLKNISLKAVEKPSLFTFCTLKRSNSLPTVHEQQESVKILFRCKSAEKLIRSSDNMPHEASPIKKASFMKISVLEKQSTVPTEFQDESNVDDISEMNHYKSLSCPLEYPVQSFKRNIQKLDDRIINHKYFKGSKSSTIIQSSNISAFASVEVNAKMKHDSIVSKIRLLEKRFSPSKDIGEHAFGKCAFDEPLKSVNNVKDHKLPKVVSVAADDVPNDKMIVLKKSPFNQAPSTEIHKSSLTLKLNQNTQLLTDNNNTNKKIIEPSKDHSGDTVLQNRNTSFEESFLSPPVPCGQPPPTRAHSSTKPILSQMASKITQNKNTPVDSMLMGKSSTPFSVFSANAIEKVTPVSASISGDKLSGKRKRKNKNEKSSKRSDSKSARKADIQFTAEQLKSMISIMKLFQADI